MLRIIIQLVPGGLEHGAREVARADLGNLSNLAPTSDYSISAREGVNPLCASPAWQQQGVIMSHDRGQSVWALVARAASWAAAVAEETPRAKAPRRRY